MSFNPLKSENWKTDCDLFPKTARKFHAIVYTKMV